MPRFLPVKARPVALLLAASAALLAPAPAAAQSFLSCGTLGNEVRIAVALDTPQLSPGVTFVPNPRENRIPLQLELKAGEVGPQLRALWSVFPVAGDTFRTEGRDYSVSDLEVVYASGGATIYTDPALTMRYSVSSVSDQAYLKQSFALLMAVMGKPGGEFTVALRPLRARPGNELVRYTIPNAVFADVFNRGGTGCEG